MNEHDKGNLRFLMSLDKRSMKKWMLTVTKDDLDYAFALLMTAALDESEQENAEIDCSEAKSILQKYTLGQKSEGSLPHKR
jgi:hypothetical protein